MSPPGRFTCEEVFQRLDLYVDLELTAEETALVKEHLAICAACTRVNRFEQTLLEGLKASIRRLDVPASVIERIVGARASRL